MPKNLLIVESPAKAKTIEKILGKDFTVKSSFGHVRDLEKTDRAVDIDNDFTPRYIVTPDKQKVVKDLKDWVKKVDDVWLATDEDREGEAISWHLCQVLGLDEHKTKRIVFREITAPAIQKAITSPRTLDLDLVNAQQARRVLDRLVGYELSELLWKKIRGKLSAGRVQSVAVKLIVEREREIRNFDVQSFFKLLGQFKVLNDQGREVILKAESPQRFENLKEAENSLQRCVGAKFEIENIEHRPLRRKPAAPFTTSTLQQEASRKLGFSVNRTMTVAQRLYEAGYITYMRTDSTNLSELALQSIAQQIEHDYGARYLQTRRYKNKSAGAQEAHEAIRPTYMDKLMVSSDRDEQRLYELIRKRTIASQMADAELEKTVATIGISTAPDLPLRAEGEVLTFDGFLKVYLESNDDEEEEETAGMLPPLKIGQHLPLIHLQMLERFTRPPARYSEAALVSKLEELGIGRPSTYAPTISRIMESERGYVVKENREGTERTYLIRTLHPDGRILPATGKEMTGAIKNRLFPTDMGMAVTDFLDEYFENIMNYNFTADIELRFDDIAEGKQDWRKMLKDFYLPFHEQVEQTLSTADRVSRERILGKDPSTGHTVLTRLSRNGPVVQIGSPEELEEDQKPRYANLPPGASMEEITFEEAMKLFALPRIMGQYKGMEVTVGAGRYGPYVKYGDKYVSLGRGEDPFAVDMARCQQLIEEKELEDAPIASYQGLPITKGKGRFGPFIKWKDLFVNVPARYKLETLTAGQAIELLEAKLDKEANRIIQEWPDLKISIENGRWGPYIKFGKENLYLPKVEGERMNKEQAALLTLDEVKAIIEKTLPDAFAEKPKPAAKKKTAVKTAADKTASTKRTTSRKK